MLTVEQKAEPGVSAAQLPHLLGDLVTVANRLTRLAAQSTESAESPAVWRTLSALVSLGPVRLGELARQSRVSQPTMTKIIRNLDQVDWVKRIVDVDDGRAWQIAITPKGEEALHEWRDTLAEALVPHFSGLTPEELEHLTSATRILQQRVDVGTLLSKRDDA